MWHLRRPSAAQLRAFLEEQRARPFSYREVGATRGRAPEGYDLDENRVRLGAGAAVFERARAALRRWEMFPAGWSFVEPREPIEEGRAVAVVFHALGLWWPNAARIVYVFEESAPILRSGFAYGTLPGHVEEGEERFGVEWLADDSVWYDLRAFSRPRFWAARLARPLARALQRRFVRDSQAALRAAVERAPGGGAREGRG